MNIKITADSTCDLSADILKEYNIAITPLTVIKAGTGYIDGVTITPAEIFAHVAAGGDLCSTSAVSVGEYQEHFTKYAGEYDGVVHICISSDFSSTYRHACIAAEDFENVRVVDSRNLSTGQGLVVLKACELAKTAASLDELKRELDDFTSRVEASFLVDRLDYLVRGGRCSSAAALGAKLAISGPEGHMVVDIGGGTTDIAVLSLNGIATSSSIKVAGDTFDEAVAAYMRKHYGMLIGLNTAEEVKITIGCVYPRPQELSMLVKGRDAKTGLPNEVTISSTEMLDAFKRPARQIVDEVLAVLEHSSPELVADIAQTGIVLTGGGSLLYGFDKLISERTEIACSIADDADSCVANGCGRSLQWISSMQEGTINLARRKLMKEQ